MLISLSRRVAGAFKAQYLLSAAASVTLAACSQSIERFASNPSDADPVYTASVAQQQEDYTLQRRSTHQTAASSEDAISSKPLASAPLSKPSGGYNYSTSYRAPAYKQPQLQTAQTTTQPAPMTAAEQQVAPARTAAAGGSVTVGPGMTLYSIARGNGMTVSQLAGANGLKPPYSVHQGQVLRIPAGANQASAAPAKPKIAAVEPAPVKEKVAVAEPAPKKAEPAPKKAKAAQLASAKSGSYQVESGDTLYSLGRKYGVTAAAIAEANSIDARKPLKLGAELKIPAASATVAKADTGQPAGKAVQETIADNGGDSATVAEATTTPSTLQPVPAPAKPAAAEQTAADSAAAAPADAAAGMRWPVRGKIISGFGAKPNGLKNEGINIAVPEGTSIRAADAGVVAYAGNELKGYGNLVLIRHEGGMVTAYAHAKELFVKRGDTVKRGDVIAKAGQTGSVTSPQLHFEVRKGATALDPLTYLNSATAAN